MPTNAQLIKQLAEMTARAETAEKRVETLTTDLTGAGERADRERDGRQAAEKELDTARGEVAELGKQLRAYKGSATKARNEITVLKANLSPEARPIGAMKPAKAAGDEAARTAALEDAFANGPTQIVFSNGRREIRALAPLIVNADAWQQTPHDRVLNYEPLLEIAGETVAEVEIAGFGLLNEAGDQVAYHALPTPIAILAGQRMQLPKGCIRF